MNEQFPTPEKLPIERAEVLVALKANGMQHAETKELVDKWVDQVNAAREKTQSTQEHKEEVHDAMIEASITIALLYRDAGMYQEAWEELEEVGYIALNARRDDICARIHILLNEIEGIPRG